MSVALFLAFGFGQVAQAQTEDVIIGGTDTVVLEEEVLEGIEVEEITEVPSGFGLFWRGVRERVSLISTFDPVKKAEKQIKYAEERLRIADIIAEKSDNPKVQARAEQMVERANNLMAKVEEKKEKWVNNPKAKTRNLIKNIATHELRRERVMDRLEEKLPEDRLEKIREVREKALNRGERLLNAINNENVPERVREHLQNVKTRIEEHAEEVKAFREERKELQQQARGGDEDAKAKLGELKEERKEAITERRESYKEKKVQLREDRADVKPKPINKAKVIQKRAEIRKEVIDRELNNSDRQKREGIFSPGGWD